MCPNIAECWGKHRTATFMILGDICTRACAFCAVTSGRPTEYDLLEPARVAAAIADLKLKHAVITSVDRDDLEDGGASYLPKPFVQIRKLDSDVKIELLTPDFQGSLDSVRTILDAGPDIFSHNIETVRRLYPSIRFKSDYTTSFGLFKAAKGMDSQHRFIKTGIMVGLGEDKEEIVELTARRCRGGSRHFHDRPIPAAFHQACRDSRSTTIPTNSRSSSEMGWRLGIRWVFSGPLVRSSYHAEDVFDQMLAGRSAILESKSI